MGEHGGTPFGDGSGGGPWHGTWPSAVPGGHWLNGPGEYLPLLLMAILIGVLVWAVVRTARTQGGRATIPAASGDNGSAG